MITNRFDHRILPEEKLIIRSFHGRLELHNLIEYLKLQIRDPLFKPGMNIINDLRNASLRYDEKDIRELINFIAGDINFRHKWRVANITCTPQQTVYTIMLEILKENPGIQMQTFSTIQAGLRWINPENRIKDLKAIEKLIIDMRGTHPTTDSACL